MNHYPDLTDSELLELLKSGDQAAYRALFDRYYTDLCRQATLRLNGDTYAAEEVVQQVFIDFWVKKRYKSVDNQVNGYLAQMMRHQSAEYVRIQVNKRGYEEKRKQLTRDDDSADLAESLMEKMESERTDKAIKAAIAELPDQCRNVFTAVYIEGLKYKQVADHYNISVNTVKIHLKRAMAKLRETLKDFMIFLTLLSPILHLLTDYL